ncbi:RNB domain-containing ribonuclease [Novosphingobium sp. BL-52-GroH]|uniref:RNB domain-containing ribonuclease n=1 Tax=Novosphingobium sp. BL-52-GroH TaxID=3349877 RepID=UPI00384AC050
MKALHDPDRLLGEGLARIRDEFTIPAGFPPEVLEAARRAAAQAPGAEHVDRTDRSFVTLDPAASTDLDQAFAIEPAGADWLLHYAIADVAWFVREGDPLDTEAWKRGTTTYLPDDKASLYPPALCEGAASLLPDVDRPAVILTTRIDPQGEASLDGVERALVRSRAKLAYETVRDADLPEGFAQIAQRVGAAEQRRGAARVDPPEQVLEADGSGGFTLSFRPMLVSEVRNAALSLAANLAVAQAMLAARTGLFRVMPPPDPKADGRLRASARALRLDWPANVPLDAFERALDPSSPPQAAFMMAIRRAGNGASYKPFDPAEPPWHAAIAAPYAHATAPLRRLADRYVLRAVLALANGDPVAAEVEEAFSRLPKVMARAASRDGRIERAVIDLAETVMLAGQEGSVFTATVTDLQGDTARLQFQDMPVIAGIHAPGAFPGESLQVRLTQADPARRTLAFEPFA